MCLLTNGRNEVFVCAIVRVFGFIRAYLSVCVRLLCVRAVFACLCLRLPSGVFSIRVILSRVAIAKLARTRRGVNPRVILL